VEQLCVNQTSGRKNLLEKAHQKHVRKERAVAWTFCSKGVQATTRSDTQPFVSRFNTPTRTTRSLPPYGTSPHI